MRDETTRPRARTDTKRHGTADDPQLGSEPLFTRKTIRRKTNVYSTRRITIARGFALINYLHPTDLPVC